MTDVAPPPDPVAPVVFRSSGHAFIPPPAPIVALNTPQNIITSQNTETNNVVSTFVTNKGLPADFQFKKDLKPLATAGDVKMLQIFLNNNGFTVSQAGAGSMGKENDYLGLKTKQALIKFQELHAKDILYPQGLKKGTGILGPYTRKVINEWLANRA